MDTGSSKALFALCQMLFVLQKNLSTRSHISWCERFFHLPIVTTSKKQSRMFGGQQFLVRRQNPLFLDKHSQSFVGSSYFANIIPKSPFGEVIIKYVCIKVPLNDVSCYTKNFTSLTCEQGCKNEK